MGAFSWMRKQLQELRGSGETCAAHGQQEGYPGQTLLEAPPGGILISLKES